MQKSNGTHTPNYCNSAAHARRGLKTLVLTWLNVLLWFHYMIKVLLETHHLSWENSQLFSEPIARHILILATTNCYIVIMFWPDSWHYNNADCCSAVAMLFVQSVYSTAGLLAEVVATMSTACFVDVLRSNFTEGGHFSCCYMYSKWKTVTSARTVPTCACVTNIEHSVVEPQCVGWVITVPPASDRALSSLAMSCTHILIESFSLIYRCACTVFTGSGWRWEWVYNYITQSSYFTPAWAKQ